MRYPYCIINTNAEPFPLLGSVMASEPFLMPLTAENEDMKDIDMADQGALQNYIDTRFAEGFGWGIAGYLEYREPILRQFPQMRKEKRYFHLGIDLAAPLDTALYAPLDAVVEETGFEDGAGNYGGFLLLRHDLDGDHFYSFYGHLDPTTLRKKGEEVRRGESFASMGEYNVNGHWFFHTHLQILTQNGLDKGFMSKGYCDMETLKTIEWYSPSPYPLLRWKNTEAGRVLRS